MNFNITISRKASIRALSLAALLFAPAYAYGCGFDGLSGNRLAALHPRSIHVAFAIRDAVDEGITPASVLNPIVPGSAGYWRAVGHLQSLHARLAASAREQAATPPISVLFIDSNLWARFHVADGRVTVSLHTPGAEAGDAEIITSEAIVTELLANRIPIDVAMRRGLIEVRGENPAQAQGWLRSAFTLNNSASTVSQVEHRGLLLFGKPKTKR
ncbi:MAG: hypothetical protein K2Y42_14275 [Hyphomicrobium sp.]|uniref:hypothetical protein n=1 Tax=Hyphomicrobium sp. TaxID=82 RepID=UPI0025C2AE7F|nr:hypothetical protein [Hyphomicrobium sp.]MBX9863908.1 hypothetical protein [Hyphomicrobium sp.]